jgi:hypothetical protein
MNEKEEQILSDLLDCKPVMIEHFREYIVFTIHNLHLRELERIQVLIYKLKYYEKTEIFMFNEKVDITYRLKLMIKFPKDIDKKIYIFKAISKYFDIIHSTDCLKKLQNYKNESPFNNFIYDHCTFEVIDKLDLGKIESNSIVVRCINNILLDEKVSFITKEYFLQLMYLIEKSNREKNNG